MSSVVVFEAQVPELILVIDPERQIEFIDRRVA